MNSCEECLSRIDFYLDDELRDDDLEIFKHHLDTCASCREQLDERRLLVELVRSARPLYSPSSAFRDRISQMLEQGQPPESRPKLEEIRPPVSSSQPRPCLKPLAALSASVFLLAATGFVLPDGGPVGYGRAHTRPYPRQQSPQSGPARSANGGHCGE